VKNFAPVRFLLGICELNLIAMVDFEKERIRDSIIDYGVDFQVPVEEDGECVDRFKCARHASENFG